MKVPTQNEKLFKEKIEELMHKYDCTLQVAVMPSGRLSRFIHWLTKRFYRLDSKVLIRSNGTPQSIPKRK